MKKTIEIDDKLALVVTSAKREELPEELPHSEDFSRFYIARLAWVDTTAFYLAKGHKQAPGQIVVWYRSGNFWTSFGTSIESALRGAIRDAWMHA